MGSKNITRLLNTIGSNYKLVKYSPPLIRNLRKIETELIYINARNYHISSPKLKETDDLITIKSTENKDSQQGLISGSLKDKPAENEKGILNEIEKQNDLSISGAGDHIVNSSNQIVNEKIVPIFKLNDEYKNNVEQDSSEKIGKSKEEKTVDMKVTKRVTKSEIGRGNRVNFLDSMKTEMKGSYSSIRKKQLKKNLSNNILFGSNHKSPSGYKEKPDTNQDHMRSLHVNDNSPFNPSTSNQLEKSLTKENDVQKQKHNPEAIKVVKIESIKKEEMNKSEKKMKENTSLETKVVGSVPIKDKQMIKSEDMKNKIATPKEKVLGSELIAEGKPKISENRTNTNRVKKSENLEKKIGTPKEKLFKGELIAEAEQNISEKKIFQSISRKTPVNQNVLEEGSISEPDSQSPNTNYKYDWNNIKNDTDMDLPLNMINSKTSKYESIGGQVQELKEDSISSKKYMSNTIQDPIAKSSQKKAQSQKNSSQSGENSVEITADSKRTKVDEKYYNKAKTVPGIGEQKIQASSDLLKGSVEQKSDIKSNQGLDSRTNKFGQPTKVSKQANIFDKKNVTGIGKVNSETFSKKGKVGSKSKPFLKVNYRIKETLKDNLQKSNKTEKFNMTDRKSEVNHKVGSKPENLKILTTDKTEKLNMTERKSEVDKKVGSKPENLKILTTDKTEKLNMTERKSEVDKKVGSKPENLKILTTDRTEKLNMTERKSEVDNKVGSKPENLKILTTDKTEKLNMTERKSEIDKKVGSKPENLKILTTDKTEKLNMTERKSEVDNKVGSKPENLKIITTDKTEKINMTDRTSVEDNKFGSIPENSKILTTDKKINVTNEKIEVPKKPVQRNVQVDRGRNFAAAPKQEELSKFESPITAIDNLQQIKKSLQQILPAEKPQGIVKTFQQKSAVIKQDFNERGLLPFDSSSVISQLAKSRQSTSFEEIPGPKLMKICSNIANSIPVLGTQTISSLLRSFNRLCLSYGDKKLLSNKMKPLESLFNRHGDIVCLNIPFCGNVILVDKPELIHEVYRQRDMNQMINSTFDSLNEAYTVLDKKRIKMDTNIDEQMTCIIEHFDIKNLFWSANRYHDSLERISDQLVERVSIIRDMHNEVPQDFIKEINKWSLECMMQVLFATEIGSLKSNSHFAHHETEKILKSLNDATDALRDCESGIQLWRVYETPSFTKLTKSIKNLERFLCNHIPLLKHETKLEQRLEILQSNLESKQNASSLISGLILTGYVDVDKLLKICMETMLIAVNTTSTSLGFILYHLARNPEKQKTLLKELMTVMPSKSSKLSPDDLQELPYLNACVQETLRLKHPIPYSFMRLQRSIMLHKYHIPAGTWVMTANEVACLREENFQDAEMFKPERWLECSAGLYQDTVTPLLEAQFEPFLGRDWLQKQLLIGTAKIIRNFNVKYRYGEIDKEGEFLSKPSKPFQFEVLEQHI